MSCYEALVCCDCSPTGLGCSHPLMPSRSMCIAIDLEAFSSLICCWGLISPTNGMASSSGWGLAFQRRFRVWMASISSRGLGVTRAFREHQSVEALFLCSEVARLKSPAAQCVVQLSSASPWSVSCRTGTLGVMFLDCAGGGSLKRSF